MGSIEPYSTAAGRRYRAVYRRPDHGQSQRRGFRTRKENHVFHNSWFDPASTAIGLDGLTPHELRHTAASLAVGAGANVKAAQRMLGHASAAMTLDTYADLLDDDLTAVADALDHRAMRSDVAKMLPRGL